MAMKIATSLDILYLSLILILPSYLFSIMSIHHVFIRLLKAQQKDEYTRNELPVAQPSDTTMQQATDYQPLESDRNRQEGTADPSNVSISLKCSCVIAFSID